LSRLFDIRHVLVHEFPEKLPLQIEEVDNMISTTAVFMDAADEGLTQLVYGRYPRNQVEMNQAARDESAIVEKALTKLTNEVEEVTKSDTIVKVQEAWRAFAEAEAHRHAEGWTGGTGYPLMYFTALEVITSARLRQLQLWLDEHKDLML
jgi:uncharacterized protein YecT (DUF1311 family)